MYKFTKLFTKIIKTFPKTSHMFPMTRSKHIKLIYKMPINYDELLNAVGTVCQQRGISVTVKESLKGGAMAGGCAALGGILMGPVGLAVGGVCGSLTAFLQAQGKFKPIIRVIKEDMNPRQREQLANQVVQALQNFDITDLTIFLPLLMGNQNAQMAAVTAVIHFLEREMRMQVTNG